MSEERRLFDPGVGQTEQERFIQIDRNCAGLPPKGCKSWDELEATAREDYEANRNAPGIQEGVRAIEARIDKATQEDVIAYYGVRSSLVRKNLKKLEASLGRVRKLIERDPELYAGADKGIAAQIDDAQNDLRRCLYHIAKARRQHDHKDGKDGRKTDTNGSGAA